MAIQFVDLALQYEALKQPIASRIQAVLSHGKYIMGPEVEELEFRLANFTGATHCITCSSGTEALLISLMALGIGPGDEVITTPFTFVAAVEMIVLLGAKPVMIDIQSSSFNLDPAGIESVINQRTKAILPVSLFGQTADMDEISAIAARHGLPVVEDAAQSLGSSYKGRQSGNLSTIACTSFFPSKPLGCYGDGGAIFTSNNNLANAMREIRVHGQGSRYHHTRVGVGGRMDTLQCSVVLAKMERFEWEIEQRKTLGNRYSNLLGDCKVIAPLIATDRTSVYAQYTIRTQKRDAFAEVLRRQGIPTSVHYPTPIHRQPAYAGLHDGRRLQETDKASEEVISLPMYPDMDFQTQDKIVLAVRQALEEIKNK